MSSMVGEAVLWLTHNRQHSQLELHNYDDCLMIVSTFTA